MAVRLCGWCGSLKGLRPAFSRWNESHSSHWLQIFNSADSQCRAGESHSSLRDLPWQVLKWHEGAQISFTLLVLKGLLLNQRTIQCPKCSISLRTIVSSGDSPVQVLAWRSWPALWENFSSTVAYRVLNSVDTCIFSWLSPTPLLQSLSTPPKVDKHFSG